MNHGDRWPLGRRKTAKLLMALTLLAWATQLLVQSWGFGQVVSNAPQTDAPEQAAPTPPDQQFISSRQVSPAMELRGESIIIGDEIRLKQICRWKSEDRAAMAPLADLIVDHVPAGKVFTVITLAQLQKTLTDAGINVAPLRFTGTSACTVSRSDLPSADPDVLDQWVHESGAANAPAAKPGSVLAVATSSADPLFAQSVAAAQPPADDSARTLRRALLEDLSTRSGIPVDQFQVEFRPQDLRLLNLSEPLFHFRVDGTYTRQLGDIRWSVEIASKDGAQHLSIPATVRAWQNQLVVIRPLATHQVIRDTDVEDKRTLVDHLSNDPMLTRPQVVGQETAHEISPGTPITSRMVDPVELAKAGQLITVTLSVGSVSIRTSGRAMDAGTFGQCINVRNEETHDIYQVTLTGPQEGTMTPQSAPLNSVASAQTTH